MMPALIDRIEPVARATSGIPGLDPLVGGGWPLHRTILLCGDIGTGKTTLGVQFLMAGVAAGQAGVLVCVDEKPQHVLADAGRLGWDVEGAIARRLLTVLDASPFFTALRGRGAVDARHVAGDLAQQVRRTAATRLVIDGAASLAPDRAVADFMRSLVTSLEDNLGCTTIVTARTSNGAHTLVAGTSLEELTSGVVELRIGPADSGGGRSMVVRKMRGGPAALGPHAFDIVDGRGLVLRPER
jgi:circadian clock protein KaiC